MASTSPRRRAARLRTTSRCREELANCRPYLERELELLKEVRVVVALGGVALRTYLGILRDRGAIKSMAAFPFGHDRVYHFSSERPSPELPVLIASYHPSQQNTSTGKLTAAMLREDLRAG